MANPELQCYGSTFKIRVNKCINYHGSTVHSAPQKHLEDLFILRLTEQMFLPNMSSVSFQLFLFNILQ